MKKTLALLFAVLIFSACSNSRAIPERQAYQPEIEKKSISPVEMETNLELEAAKARSLELERRIIRLQKKQKENKIEIDELYTRVAELEQMLNSAKREVEILREQIK